MNILLLPIKLVLAQPKVGHALNEFIASVLEATGRKVVEVRGIMDNQALRDSATLYRAAAVLRRNRDLGRTAAR